MYQLIDTDLLNILGACQFCLRLREGYESGLEAGDLEYAAYSIYNYCALSYCVGKKLTDLEEEMAVYDHAISQINQKTALNFHKIFRQAVLVLRGKTESLCHLIGEAYDE